MQRKKYILGNWKLNKNLAETRKFFSVFNNRIVNNKNIVYGFGPTYLCLGLATNLKKGQTIIMAQDVSDKISGSYTGQTSCLQLKDFKINYAIIGHSEARKYLGCDDNIVNAKALTCLANKITPVICIGESLAQYNKNQTKQVLAKQLRTIFKGVKDASKCLIAYEPLWAIDSGKTPTTKEISSLCGFIRKTIAQLFNKTIADKTPILYGGSVNEKNGLTIVTLPNVDGALIGGVSLDPIKFAQIIKEVDKWTKK